MSKLTLQPPRVPMVDPNTGVVTTAWYRWFTDSFIRQGGIEAPTIGEVSTTIVNLTQILDDQIYAPPLLDRIESDDVSPACVSILPGDDLTPPQAIIEAVEFLQTEVRSLAEQLAAALNQIQELKQGTML